MELTVSPYRLTESADASAYDPALKETVYTLG